MAMKKVAQTQGTKKSAEKQAPEQVAPALPKQAVIDRSVLRELLDFLDSIPGYLAKTWEELEALADEANAGSRFIEPGAMQRIPTKDDLEAVYDHVEDHRRPAVKGIRFTLSNVEFVRNKLSSYAMHGMSEEEWEAEGVRRSAIYAAHRDLEVLKRAAAEAKANKPEAAE